MCFAKTTLLSTYRFVHIANNSLSADASEIVPLDVNFMGFMMDPTSYATGLISLSVLFQLVCFLSTSALADYGNFRKVCVTNNGDSRGTSYVKYVCLL